MRFEFIDAKKADYPVSVLCDVLEVRRSGYYAYLKRGDSATKVENRRLTIEVRATFRESRGRYGSPRIRHALRARGIWAGRHRIARLMREQQLCARRRRRFVKTTDSRHNLPTPPNVLARDFTATAPNRKWAGDVTFISTREGWVYLAVLLDLFSRCVVGWAMSEHNDESLTLAALEMALDQRQPRRGLVHHSDRGTTYASGTYQDVLRQHGIVCSMSRKGNCWDNAVAESFFSTLDIECGTREMFPSRAAAHRAVTEYLVGFYNPNRLHSTLGYVSPMEFERTARRRHPTTKEGHAAR